MPSRAFDLPRTLGQIRKNYLPYHCCPNFVSLLTLVIGLMRRQSAVPQAIYKIGLGLLGTGILHPLEKFTPLFQEEVPGTSARVSLISCDAGS